MSLIFANVSEEDIILKGHIDQLAKQHPGRFSVHYVVDKVKPGAKWAGGVGGWPACRGRRGLHGVAQACWGARELGWVLWGCIASGARCGVGWCRGAAASSGR